MTASLPNSPRNTRIMIGRKNGGDKSFAIRLPSSRPAQQRTDRAASRIFHSGGRVAGRPLEEQRGCRHHDGRESKLADLNH